MTRKIVVLGNCQVVGVAAALQRIYWDDEVRAVPLNRAVHSEQFLEQIVQADMVFGGQQLQAIASERPTVRRKITPLPAIYFSAFHPDMVAVQGPNNKRFAYNSAICVWAYNKGLNREQTMRLFARQTFSELGYFDRWRASVIRQKSAFEAAGAEFERFYLAAKRLGTFMHTVNHPTAALLCCLAKTVAISAGFEKSVWHKDISINDALGQQASWGVYPEIGYELGVHGAYAWQIDRSTLIQGLDNFVEYNFQRYADAGMERGSLRILGVKQDAYDAVLSSALGNS